MDCDGRSLIVLERCSAVPEQSPVEEFRMKNDHLDEDNAFSDLDTGYPEEEEYGDEPDYPEEDDEYGDEPEYTEEDEYEDEPEYTDDEGYEDGPDCPEEDEYGEETTDTRGREFKETDIGKDEIMEILLNTREQGQLMEGWIKNQISVKDGLIDKLHEELEKCRIDHADRFAEQLMKALIKVRKDMIRLTGSERWETMSAEELRREYVYVQEDISDLLEQQDIDRYETAPGEEFDPSIHRAKVEKTDDPSLNKKIKASLSEGYKKGEKVLIPERVVAYRYST